MHPLVNKKAPDFNAKDQSGNDHWLSDYEGEYILLYFYPRDLTPGCTTEACTFRDAMNDFKEMGIQVIGVSADDEASHKKFAEKYDLNYPLLADVNKKIVQDYGVWKDKSMYGKKYMGIQRDSFLIDPKGMVLKHYEKVKPAKHPAEVLEDIRGMN